MAIYLFCNIAVQIFKNDNKMTEQVFLPVEIEQMAQNVSVKKRNKVQTVLNHVFNGVSKMREQLDLVVVVDENDKTSMRMANTIRLGVRQVRLDAEKEFDTKRSEVQQQMLSFKTEDALWLKAKQTMQILTKEIEETAKWKEATKERIEAERKECIIQDRIIKVSKFNNEVVSTEYANMSDSMFDLFLSGLEKQYNDKIEAEKQAESERLRIIEAEKETARIKAIEDERIRIENANLKAEAERKELELKAEREKAERELKLQKELAEKEAKRLAGIAEIERQKAEVERRIKAEQDNRRNSELRPFIVLIRDYSKVLNLDESDYQKELSDLEIAYKQELEYAESERLKKIDIENKRIEELQKAEADRIKLEAEIKAKNEAELKAKQESERKEKERIEAEKKASKAPDKEKLTKWIESLNIAIPELNDLSATVTASDISAKFEGFKKWAKSEIEKL